MDDQLDEADLKAIEDRCASASAGPWRSFIEGREQMSGSSFIQTGPPDGPDIYLSGGTDADQDFIAAARQDIPRLINEIRRLRTAAAK